MHYFCFSLWKPCSNKQHSFQIFVWIKVYYLIKPESFRVAVVQTLKQCDQQVYLEAREFKNSRVSIWASSLIKKKPNQNQTLWPYLKTLVLSYLVLTTRIT